MCETDRIYIYLDHDEFFVFPSRRPLTDAELYCPRCGTRGRLLAVCDGAEALREALCALYGQGYAYYSPGEMYCSAEESEAIRAAYWPGEY